MRFEWDEVKNRRNLAKHKVAFESARLVFYDPHALSLPERVVEYEQRWKTMGMVFGVLIIVAHTYRDEDGYELIRLISATESGRR